MSHSDSAPSHADWPRALWGVLLSLFFPGLGQIYARSWRLGVILLAISVLLLAGIRLLTRLVPPLPGYCVLGLGLLVCLILFELAAAADAALRMRGRHARPRPAWARSTWFAGIVSLAVSTGLGVMTPVGWRPFSIPSGSNLPTILVGDRVVTDIRDPGIMPDRGDIVFFKFPRDPSVTYVKRVVGLPGDRIRIEHGQLSINGQPVPREAAGTFVADDDGLRMSYQRYIEVLPNGRRYAVLQVTGTGAFNNTPEYHVPPDTFFVLGDNRDNSADSRMTMVGYIPVQNLIGRGGTVVLVARSLPDTESNPVTFAIRTQHCCAPAGTGALPAPIAAAPQFAIPTLRCWRGSVRVRRCRAGLTPAPNPDEVRFVI